MNYQKKSNISFAELAKREKIYDSAGRKIKDGNLREKIILKDIIHKLNFKKHSKLLDIGCGCGKLTKLLINRCKRKKIKIYLNDIHDVVKNLKKFESKNIKILPGIFQKINFNEKFDYILMYSVLHYVNYPNSFISKAYGLLKNNGRMLVADIPNLNKKARFLTSKFGENFEKKVLKNKSFKKYKNFKHFINANKNTRKDINDDFLLKLLKKYRKLNCNVYLIEQNNKLPSCYTREDILVEKIK